MCHRLAGPHGGQDAGVLRGHLVPLVRMGGERRARGYAQHVALIVDAVTASTVFWVLSGVYIWARRPRKRLLGGLCLAGGCLLFAFLAISLSQ